jgi:hypothetical protein
MLQEPEVRGASVELRVNVGWSGYSEQTPLQRRRSVEPTARGRQLEEASGRRAPR